VRGFSQLGALYNSKAARALRRAALETNCRSYRFRTFGERVIVGISDADCDEHSKAAFGSVWTGPLPSPGRPSVAGRDERRRFWAAIAAGMASEDAAVEAGVSQAIGTGWFREAGGMPPAMFGLSGKPLSRRYLSLAEREEIALLRVQGYSIQEIARRLGLAASTISRELRRNAATRSGGLEYRATTAQWHAERSARRPKQVKLVRNLHWAPMWKNDRLVGGFKRSSRHSLCWPMESTGQAPLRAFSSGASFGVWR
jgi:transposase-like protein